MKRLAKLLAVALFTLSGLTLAAAPNTKATLVLAADAARPGDTVLAAVRLTMAPKWHTYWKNPGGPGIATEIAWELPPGITAGDIQWPVPKKHTESDITTYVYYEEAALLVPLQLSADLKPGPLEIKARVDWLECEIQCLPGSARVTAQLEIADTTKPSSSAKLFAAWQDRLPRPGDGLAPNARWESGATADTRALVVEWISATPVTEPDFFPYAYDNLEFDGATEVVTTDGGNVRVRKRVRKLDGDWPREIAGLLIQQAGGQPQGFAVQIPVADAAVAPAVRASLWQMLLFAFIGGMILNIMPCVLPVIALKILGFVSQARENPRRVRQLGLIYTAGVLTSFLALAGLVVSVKLAGQQAGWGMQFNSPYFIVALTVLVTLVALNLFGWFEITLGGKVMSAAGAAASQHGAAGAFFNGVLATILATPCTAPFLGAALGFAFAQSTALIVLMFLTIGLGLAFPYVLLSWQPAWLRFLPKPGVWMERFKIAMGFPMLGVAVWLTSLATTFYAERTWWLGLFLVFVAAAIWTYGEFVQRGSRRRGLAAGIAVALLVVGYLWALDTNLRWRSPGTDEDGAAATSVGHAPRGYPWQAWSREAVAAARSEGRVVVVDFTAKWCLTCNATVKPAFESPRVIARLQELNAVALVADNTKFPPAIIEELARHGRAGVPLVLVYPAKADRPPLVLPEPLSPSATQYAGVILDALDQAAD